MATQDNSIQTFKFAEGVTVRSTIDKDGCPWFVAADVCSALELTNTTKALLRLDEDEQALITIQGISKGNDQANIINESGLYSLILTSRKSEAKKLKKWVTAEVLPAIRKTGKYEVKQPESVALQTPADHISISVEDWFEICNVIHTISCAHSEAISHSIATGYTALPKNLPIPFNIGSRASRAMGMIHGLTFAQMTAGRVG